MVLFELGKGREKVEEIVTLLPSGYGGSSRSVLVVASAHRLTIQFLVDCGRNHPLIW